MQVAGQQLRDPSTQREQVLDQEAMDQQSGDRQHEQREADRAGEQHPPGEGDVQAHVQVDEELREAACFMGAVDVVLGALEPGVDAAVAPVELETDSVREDEAVRRDVVPVEESPQSIASHRIDRDGFVKLRIDGRRRRKQAAIRAGLERPRVRRPATGWTSR